MFNFKALSNRIVEYIGFGGPVDYLRALVDIGIVSYVIYRLIKLIKDTRAVQLIRGIVIILVAAQVSAWLGLETLQFLLDMTLSYGVVALLILFQPELRRGLEHIGRSKIKDVFNFEEEETNESAAATIEEIVKAASFLSKSYTGALIVIERETKIGDIIKTGILTEAAVTSELLINVFSPNTPLHDGAVVIRGSRMMAAACFLPLTDNPDLSKELGTRHRAALGITENSDAVVVVVSEETGKISFALDGGLTRNLTPETLRKALIKTLSDKSEMRKKLSLWRKNK